MDWSTEASEILREILRGLPNSARIGVKDACEARAAELAEDEGEEEISMESAVIAVIESTPTEQHEQIKNVLAYHGIDPDDYLQVFSGGC